LGGRERGDMVVHPVGQRDRRAREVLEGRDHPLGGGALRRLGARGRIEAGERLAALLERGTEPLFGQRQDAQGQA